MTWQESKVEGGNGKKQCRRPESWKIHLSDLHFLPHSTVFLFFSRNSVINDRELHMSIVWLKRMPPCSSSPLTPVYLHPPFSYCPTASIIATTIFLLSLQRLHEDNLEDDLVNSNNCFASKKPSFF